MLKKMSIKQGWLYYLISLQQPILLNIWLFPAVYGFHAYSIS